MFNDAGSAPTVTDCAFSANNAEDLGGGMLNQPDAAPTVTGCTFAGNEADLGGGALSNSADAAFTGCAFSENDATQGGGMYVGGNGGASLTVADCTFSENTASSGGGGLAAAEAAAPLIEGCLFEANEADELGGGLLHQTSAAPFITGSTFTGNSAPLGGGIAGFEADATITNCVLAANSATTGAAISNQAATAVVTNCTVADNMGPDVLAAAVWNLGEGAAATLTNCILWNPDIRELPIDLGETFEVTYCDLQEARAGEGNISFDPLFVDAAAGDYRIVQDSPCVDTGRDSSAPEFGHVVDDREGNARGLDGDGLGAGETGDGSDYDIGAYEYAP